MNIIKFNQKTKEVLRSFIDKNEKIILYAINPRQYIKKSFMGGLPIPYHTLSNLKRRGYLKSVHLNKNVLYKLTPKGHQAVKKLIIEKAIKEKNKRKKWDGKWYILIFDIPENHRAFRDNVRLILREIGFYRLQKSAWVYPYDVAEAIYSLIPSAKEAKWFNYIIAKHISYESELKKYFNLL